MEVPDALRIQGEAGDFAGGIFSEMKDAAGALEVIFDDWPEGFGLRFGTFQHQATVVGGDSIDGVDFIADIRA